MLILTAGNLLQITLRGILFLAPGAFTEFYEAAYHSAVNFTPLGHGDIVMTQSWSCSALRLRTVTAARGCSGHQRFASACSSASRAMPGPRLHCLNGGAYRGAKPYFLRWMKE
jgi:hypothetical protein